MGNRDYSIERERENIERGAKIEGDIESIIFTYSGGDASNTLVPKSLFGLILDPLPEGISFKEKYEYFSMDIYKDFIEYAASVSLDINRGVPIYGAQDEDEDEDEYPLVFKGIIEYHNEKIATFGDYSQPRVGMDYEKWRKMPFGEYTLMWVNRTIWKWVTDKSVFLELVYKNGDNRNLSNFRKAC